MNQIVNRGSIVMVDFPYSDRTGSTVKRKRTSLFLRKSARKALTAEERAEYHRLHFDFAIQGPPPAEKQEVVMARDLRALVRRRAHDRCEYCQLPEEFAPVVPFQIEHSIARKHRGPTILSDLALSCDRCDLHKGSDLPGIDPLTNGLCGFSIRGG